MEFLLRSPGYCLMTGIPLLVMIASQPIRPRWWTVVLSVVGILHWFVLSELHSSGKCMRWQSAVPSRLRVMQSSVIALFVNQANRGPQIHQS